MGLNGTTIDVPLHPVWQQRPGNASIPGQLTYAKNCQVVKYTQDGLSAIKVEQRNGFTQQPIAATNVTTGIATTSGFINEPSVFTSLAAQQVVIESSKPQVLAENGLSWSKFDYTVPATNLTTASVSTAATQIGAPDVATIGNVSCYVWQDLVTNNNFFYVVDKDGTPLRLPVVSDGTANTIPFNAHAKVVSDGTRFWVIYSKPGLGLYAMCISTKGTVLSTATQINTSTKQFDIAYAPLLNTPQVSAVVLVGTTIDYITMTLSGFTISTATTDLGLDLPLTGIAFMENRKGDGKVYLAYHDGTNLNTYLAEITIGASPAISNFALIFNGDGKGGSAGKCIGLAGCKEINGNTYVLISFVFAQQAVPVTWAVSVSANFLTVTNLRNLQETVTGSRTFVIDGRTHCILFYPSTPAISAIDPISGVLSQGVSQPTYFMCDLQTQQITGRFEGSNAGGAWLFYGATLPTIGALAFHMPSVVSDVIDSVHVGLAYLATTLEQSTVQRNVAVNASLQNDIVNIITTPQAFAAVNAFELTATVGVKDYRFSGAGRAVEYAGELFLPGPIATTFTGATFSENGLNLAPEPPIAAPSKATLGHIALTLLATYYVVLVWEWTDQSGLRHRSAPSAPFGVALTGTQNSFSFTIPSLGMTNKPDVTLGVYMTWNAPGSPPVPSTQYRKASNDLSPTRNDPQGTTVSYTVDTTDAAIQVGELLYCGPGGLGMLPRDPCPANSGGCVYGNRVFVMGWDGRIWYSAEKVDGEPLWFNADVQTISMPTNDPMVALDPVDGRIIVRCQESSWELRGAGFSNPNGTDVAVAAPQRIPSCVGGTKHSVLSNDGVVYEGSKGGLFLMTRGMESVQFSNGITDELAGDRRIEGINVDNLQRIHVLTNGGAGAQQLVYDQLAKVWTTYLLPTNALLQGLYHGAICYVDETELMVQDRTSYVDSFSHPSVVTTAIAMDIQTEMIPFNGVKGFCRIWDQIVTGTYYAPHNLVVTEVVENEGKLQTVVYNKTFASSPPQYVFSLIPKYEECSRVSFRFQTNFTALTPANSMSLELISFWAGISKGLTRLPYTQRIGNT